MRTYLYDRPEWPHRVQLQTLSQSADLAVPLDAMMLDLRADSDDESETVEQYIRGATDYFARRTGWRLAPATYEALVLGGVCGPVITLEVGPLRELLGVECWNHTAKQYDPLDPADFLVQRRGREFDVVLNGAGPTYWPPDCFPGVASVKLRFEAGFDPPNATGSGVAGEPEEGMLTALRSLVALRFQKREAGSAAGTWEGQDPAHDFILAAYRKLW